MRWRERGRRGGALSVQSFSFSLLLLLLASLLRCWNA